jgi:hypothetical protein
VWGAAWLYKATRDVTYLQYLISNGATLGGTTESVNSFDWDNKYAGAQVLLSAVRNSFYLLQFTLIGEMIKL